VGFSSFELDLFGRVRSLKQQAAQAFLATEANQHSTKISLIAEVASAYYTLAADQALLALAQQTFNTQENTLKLTQRKLEIGVENQLTVSQQQTAVEEARADVANYTAQLAMDKNALALLVGGEVSSTLLPPLITAFPKIDVGLPTGLPSDVLTRRPDIISAEHSLLAANANIGAARAAFFPKIALTATAGSSSGDLARLFMGGTGVWSFVPSITLPIFDMGTNRANLKIANVERDISIATYEKTIQTAFKEVSDALAQATGLREQVKAYEVRQAAAQQSLQLSQARFNYGVDAYLTVLDAQRTLYSTQKTLISMQLAQLNNYASLYKVLGGGWQ
jgi:multidrug efflux system outer membrane protein